MNIVPGISPVPEAEWTPDVEAVFPILVQPGAPVKGSDFNSLLAIATHPELATKFLEFNAMVARGVVLPARLKEIAVLRVAWRGGCTYEWMHHLIAGNAVGLEDLHFRALLQEAISEDLPVEDRAVIQATDDLVLRSNLSDASWRLLSDFLDKKQVLELIFAVGCYQVNAMFLNSARIEMEPAFLDIIVSRGWPALDGRPAAALSD